MDATLTQNTFDSAPAGMPTITVRDLTKRFGAVEAVRDISFEVRPGRVTGFLGPNGAGKSTTLRVLLGLVQPSAGTATVFGMPYGSLPEPTRVVGAVLETQSFTPARSGRNHLRVIAAASGIDDERVDEVLEIVDLAESARRRAGAYSLGMRQRLGLAGALLGDPHVLILDEPANGLDPRGIRWLRGLLRGFAERGNAVLLSSHLLAEMAQLADDVVVIHRGRLVTQAPVADLIGDGARARVRSPEASRLADLLVANGIDARADGPALTVVGAELAAVGALAFDAGIPVHELTRDEPSLEDVFLELTTEEEGSR